MLSLQLCLNITSVSICLNLTLIVYFVETQVHQQKIFETLAYCSILIKTFLNGYAMQSLLSKK